MASNALAVPRCMVARSSRGHRATAANVDTKPAIAQPPTRSGMAFAGAGMVTAITNERSKPVFAAAI